MIYTKLAQAVEDVCGVTFEQLMSKDRHEDVVTARFIYIGILIEMGKTVYEIAEALKRDRSTIVVSRQKFQFYRSQYGDFRNKYNEVKSKLKSL